MSRCVAVEFGVAITFADSVVKLIFIISTIATHARLLLLLLLLLTVGLGVVWMKARLWL